MTIDEMEERLSREASNDLIDNIRAACGREPLDDGSSRMDEE